jgi:hypothetical protein
METRQLLEAGLFSTLAGIFFLLSIGILAAHAMEGVALRSDTSKRN